ncbi:hypothetical protein [Bradyrhizobium sp. HKCCYLS20291]|uniref:hypothetical protein n=1 Tax=Bradyrhizobium sp. HKCCYLS20291 TaxID=3420766 RepID=UPI003EB910CD
MSEQDDDKSPNSLRYYAPRRSRDTDGRDGNAADPPAAGGHATGTSVSNPLDRSGDPFTEAVARVQRQRRDPKYTAGPEPAVSRRARHAGVRLAFAIVAAIVVALAYVAVIPMSGMTKAASLWSAFKTAYLPGAHASLAPALIVRGSSGPANAPLDLGVVVEKPTPGMMVIIGRLPLGSRVTAGRRVGGDEWRIPAGDVADAAIIPPSDFAGEMNLPLDLRDADGTSLVKSFVHLTWAAPPSAVLVTGSTTPAPAEPKAVAHETPPVAAPPPPVAAAIPPVDPAPAWTPNEVAAFVRRAQELLASGEVQAARLQLLRAAEARDARAAILLAKTFDPVSLKQFGVADAGADLAQARIWYQRAREWGSPEAQRQLDALASYPRR